MQIYVTWVKSSKHRIRLQIDWHFVCEQRAILILFRVQFKERHMIFQYFIKMKRNLFYLFHILHYSSFRRNVLGNSGRSTGWYNCFSIERIGWLQLIVRHGLRCRHGSIRIDVQCFQRGRQCTQYFERFGNIFGHLHCCRRCTARVRCPMLRRSGRTVKRWSLTKIICCSWLCEIILRRWHHRHIPKRRRRFNGTDLADGGAWIIELINITAHTNGLECPFLSSNRRTNHKHQQYNCTVHFRWINRYIYIFNWNASTAWFH